MLLSPFRDPRESRVQEQGWEGHLNYTAQARSPVAPGPSHFGLQKPGCHPPGEARSLASTRPAWQTTDAPRPSPATPAPSREGTLLPARLTDFEESEIASSSPAFPVTFSVLEVFLRSPWGVVRKGILCLPIRNTKGTQQFTVMWTSPVK